MVLYHIAEYDPSQAIDPVYREQILHVAQDQEKTLNVSRTSHFQDQILLKELTVEEVQELSSKHGPGLNFSITGTGPQDQLARKLKVSPTRINHSYIRRYSTTPAKRSVTPDWVTT